MIRPIAFLALSVTTCSAFAATTPHPFGRPLIPDMVADASIVDIDGVFYCYATIDGWASTSTLRARPWSGSPATSAPLPNR